MVPYNIISDSEVKNLFNHTESIINQKLRLKNEKIAEKLHKKNNENFIKATQKIEKIIKRSLL